MTLTKEQKLGIFKALVDKSSYEVGLQFGLDKHYKSAAAVGVTVLRAYNHVKNNPEEYGVSPDMVQLVTEAVKSRTQIMRSGEQKASLREQIEAGEKKTIEELVMSNRQKAWLLLQLRLDDLLSSKKKREKVSIGEVAKVAGINFDKGQLLEGKATDHVALMAKIEGNMTPSQAMDIVLKMREYNQAVAEKKDK